MADIVTDLNSYFDSPTPSACQILAMRGAEIIPGGFVVIISRLRALTNTTAARAIMVGPEGEWAADQMIRGAGMNALGHFLDVIVRCGPAGSVKLLSLLTHADPDIRALAALELMSEDMRHVSARQPLDHAYRRARGTGLRIAFALALAAHGDLQPLKSLTVTYLLSDNVLQELLESARRVPDPLPTQVKEDAVYQGFAAPRGMLLVVMDIATNGMMPRHSWPQWVRE
ncbi:MAG: hypothetical protein ACRDHP_15595 [Ktedonobacterales bacterium]